MGPTLSQSSVMGSAARKSSSMACWKERRMRSWLLDPKDFVQSGSRPEARPKNRLRPVMLVNGEPDGERI
jgi:hypothetical protein